MISNLLLLQYLLYMNPAIGLNFDLITEHCFLFDGKSQIRACNRVCSQGIPASDEIAKIKTQFNGKPFTWAVDSNDLELAKTLEQNNFTYLLSFPAMIIDLDSIAIHESDDAITIKEISNDSEELKKWIEIAAASFERSAIELEKFITHFKQIIHPNHLKLYLAYYHGQAASTAIVVHHGTVASIHWVGTSKEFRKKGLCYAISHNALCQARLEGVQQTVLLSSVHGKKIYERLGFKEYAFYHMYGF